MKYLKEGISFSVKLPSKKVLSKVIGSYSFIIVCDKKLKKLSQVKSWLKNQLVYDVSAGEQLKELSSFDSHVQKVLKLAGQQHIQGFVSLGGGSVGDFTGFLASVYHRGVPFVNIPSTWLSMMDSAHGGKTALNVKAVKNILGSYHSSKAVFIVKNLLSSLSLADRQSAQGELIKMALISGGSFYQKLIKVIHKNSHWDIQKSKNSLLSKQEMWEFLPQAISAKLKIIKQDPFEKKGIRQKLNFGHTLGHVLESYFQIPHGVAVFYGMVFAFQWSHRLFSLSPAFLKQISFLFQYQVMLSGYLKSIPSNKLKTLLLQDKKRISSEKINFIFIKKPGDVFIKTVSISQILKEICRQRICSE